MLDEDDSPLYRALRALGARVSPRLDGYEFQLEGFTGQFVLGEEVEDREVGPFTVCRMQLPTGGPVFAMELRPQTEEEQSAVARGDAIDAEVGDVGFDRAFVVEAAPSQIVRILLGEQMRAALLALTPCRFACLEGHVSLSKQGTWTRADVVQRIVRACVDFAKAVQQLPAELARQREAAGYRGERIILRPEDEAGAAEELARVEDVRRTRRQLPGGNVGLLLIAAIVAMSTLYAWCSHV